MFKKAFKKLFIFSTVIISISSFSSDYFCHQRQFLYSGFLLTYDEGIDLWSFKSPLQNGHCQLLRNGGVLTPAPVSGDFCFLSNRSKPDVDREVLEIHLDSDQVNNSTFYIKVSLDNSFAEYGPNAIKGLIFCQKEN